MASSGPGSWSANGTVTDGSFGLAVLTASARFLTTAITASWLLRMTARNSSWPEVLAIVLASLSASLDNLLYDGSYPCRRHTQLHLPASRNTGSTSTAGSRGSGQQPRRHGPTVPAPAGFRLPFQPCPLRAIER